MSSAFDDSAAFQHVDFIHHAGGRQSVRNDNDGLFFRQGKDQLIELVLREGIQRGGGLIQN